MRNEWFNDESSQFADSVADFLVFAHASVNPFFDFSEFLIYSNQSKFSSSFNQLIWLHD